MFGRKTIGVGEHLFVDVAPLQELSPEEILPDSYGAAGGDVAEDPYLEVPVGYGLIKALFGAFFCVLVLLGGYLSYLVTTRGDQNYAIAQSNAQRIYKIGPSRGEIYDRNGTVLATSTKAFNLIANPTRFNGEQEVVDGAQELYRAYPAGPSLTTITEKLIQGYRRNLGHIVLFKNLDSGTVAGMSETIERHDAFYLQETSIRYYPYAEEFAHIVGYAGAVSEEELAAVPDYARSDQVGKQGIEYYFEQDLRGLDGLFVKFVGIHGGVEEEKLLREPNKGASATLTVDERLQRIAHEELSQGMAELGITSGAVVALDPRDGAVRALVSMPDFNPNAFSRGLTQDEAAQYFTTSNRPLFNRATMGTYPSGSTIKPIIAIAALEENVISPLRSMVTNGFIRVTSVFDPSVSWTFLDWKNHGVVDMRRAIAVSSNVYFYTIGGGYQGQDGLGIDRMATWLTKFNWGKKLGILFDAESSGLVPNPEWKKETIGEDWYIGDTYNTSIGQGNILATPLQIAASISAIANNGTLYTPYAVSRLERPDGTTKLFFPDAITQGIASAESLRVAREGMRDAVNEGSSQILKSLPITFAGKTGTAEIGDGENHGMFVGFGPYENPEITIVVLLERGEGSTNAVYVARDILQRYYGGDELVQEGQELSTSAEE